MNKKVIKVLFIACLSFVFAFSLSYAKEKGKGKNKNKPPGWDQGEKKGWQSDIPQAKTRKMESKRKKEINLKIIKGKNLNPKVSKTWWIRKQRLQLIR